jgi:hypothetical protein
MLKRFQSITWLPEALALSGAIVFLAQLVYFAHTQFSVIDEGLYLYKGFLFTSGRYTPFQDYGPLTNQMPFSFLLPGLVQVMFGPGLRAGRYFAVLLALVMVFALWLIGRRLSNRWLAAGLVWLTALNPATARMYSLAISEGTIACLVMLVLALTLGSKRPLWQLLLGSALAGIIMMMRINMLPLPIFLFFYIAWQYDWKKGLWAALAGIATVLISHALYWPNILRLWTYWLPASLTPFLDAFRPPASADPLYDPTISIIDQVWSFAHALRFHFPAFAGALLAWAFWPVRAAWKREEQFRAAVFLSVTFIVLVAMHAWASLGKNYCVYCFPIYAAFYSGIGLLLTAISMPSWQLHLPRLRKSIPALIVFGFFVTGAFVYYANKAEYLFPASARALVQIQVPRLGQGRILPGTVDLWKLVTNLTGISYENILLITDFAILLAICAGITIGLGLLIWAISKFWRLKNQSVTSRMLLVTSLAGCLLLPTNLMANGWQSYDCGYDEISNYEKVGAELAQVIPAGSSIFWRGYSPVNLLYLPDIVIYPSQLNGDYSFRLGGDPDALLRYGWWSEPLGRQWAAEADFIIVEEKYNRGWLQDLLESGIYEEYARLPSNAPCRDNASLIVFQLKP